MSISRKLGIGFGVLVALTLVVAGLAYMGGTQATNKIHRTERLRLPTVLASVRAQADLLRMLAAMRGYLALGDKLYRDEYNQARQTFEGDLVDLNKLAPNWTSTEDRNRLDKLQALVAAWSPLPDRLFELRDNQLEREPALRILTEQAQPLISKMIREINHMIETQGERMPTSENLSLLEDMARFESSLIAMVAGLRGYVTTGRESFKFEYTTNIIGNDAAFEILINQRSRFKPSQQAAMDTISQNRNPFLTLPPRMFEIVESNQARKDLYVFTTEAVPLAEKMLQLLDEMTSEEQRLLQVDLHQGAKGLTLAHWETLIVGLVALILGLSLAIILQRKIVGPIKRLTQVAEQIQEGDLTGRAGIESKDEIGTLAETFNNMTDQLRETLRNLEQRKGDLERRSVHLQVAAEVARDATAALDLDEFLNRAVNLIQSRFDFFYAGIFLLEKQSEYAVLRAAAGEVGRQMLERGHKLKMENGDILGHVDDTGRPRIILNAERDSKHDKKLLMSETCSKMILPLMVGERAIGALEVQCRQEVTFNEGDALVLQTMADQLAVAFEKMRLFEQTQTALEERLQSVVSNAPIVIFALDGDGRITLAEGKGLTPLDFEPGELVGRSAFDLFRERPGIFEDFRSALKGESCSSMLAMGELIFEAWWTPLRDRKGNIIGVTLVATDITERKQAEEDLKVSEIRYRSLFENSPISLWEEDFSQGKEYFDRLRKSGITDFRAYFENNAEAVAHCVKLVRIMDINKATLDLLSAKDKDELYAGLPNVFTEESLAVFREELIMLAEGGRRFESEAVQRALTGEDKHVVLHLSVAPGYEDSLGKVLVSLLDITERKQAEKELEKHRQHLEALVEERTAELTVAKDQAQAANVAKSDFLARMSHEIRTPLNAVIGLTNIVLKSELTAEQRDYLSKVQLASDNLLAVINDILDFSKVESDQLKLVQHPFELDQVIKQLADLFSDHIAKKDLELIFTVNPNVPRQLTGDAGRLAQVLTNLIQNAVKFTERGEIVVGVGLDEEGPVVGDQVSGDRIISVPMKDEGRGTWEEKLPGQTALKFSVSDTGVGIVADVLPTLFEPFTQADSYLTREYEGTGLGLAICRRLVELMGGRIWAESTPGQGSTFSFTVMMETRIELPEAVEPRPAQEPVTLPIQRLTGHRVLVVEDSELNRDVALVLLEEAGLMVETAENGRIAVDKVTESPKGYYNAVFMDIQMPVMDGYQATKKIREFEKQQDATSEQPETKTPIIALTAHALKGEKEKCLAADMDDYLSKPLNERDLYRVLLKWIVSQPEEADTAKRIQSRGPSDDQGVLDVQGALKRLGGRKPLYVKVSRKFESESAKAHAIITRHLTASDMEAASRTAHTVKGEAAAIGAVNLSQVAAELETAIRNNFPEIGDLLSVFKSELDKTLQSVNEFLEAESEG